MKTIIDAYLEKASKDDKKILSELREIVNSISSFEEDIYYGIPSFIYNKGHVAAFRVYSRHIGFYPCSGSILDKFKMDLKEYKTSTGAIQFPKNSKLPAGLIRRIVRARMREIDNNIKVR